MLFSASSCRASPCTRSSEIRLLPPSMTASTQQSWPKLRETCKGALGCGMEAATGGGLGAGAGGAETMGGACRKLDGWSWRRSTNQAASATRTRRISPTRASSRP